MELALEYIYNVNWFAVVVAAAVGMAVNAAWYSDMLFGKVWMKSVGLKAKDTKKPGVDLAFVIAFLTLIITAAAVAVLADALQVFGAWNGLLLGTLIGFGFLVTNSGMHKLFEQRPFTHFVITAVGDILTLAAMGVILAVW